MPTKKSSATNEIKPLISSVRNFYQNNCDKTIHFVGSHKARRGRDKSILRNGESWRFESHKDQVFHLFLLLSFVLFFLSNCREILPRWEEKWVQSIPGTHVPCPRTRKGNVPPITSNKKPNLMIGAQLYYLLVTGYVFLGQ